MNRLYIKQQVQILKIFSQCLQVGDAFTVVGAKEELETIASSPPIDHVFQVESFQALEKIRQNLQEKIFSIEGTDAILHNSMTSIWDFQK